MTTADLETDELRYARSRDKTDKSLDAFKYYINSLYVAVTRSVQNLYVLENTRKHPLLDLSGLVETRQQLDLTVRQSFPEDWQEEARRLDLQGKNEQADLIRHQMLGTQQVPRTPISHEEYLRLRTDALDPTSSTRKRRTGSSNSPWSTTTSPP